MTAIRAGDTDGNRHTAPDPDWPSLVNTPPYPSYPSNYASAAVAARAVLEKVYGKRGHVITLVSRNPAVDVTLHYTTFSQLTDDVNDARVYGGIHFRFDQDAGLAHGTAGRILHSAEPAAPGARQRIGSRRRSSSWAQAARGGTRRRVLPARRYFDLAAAWWPCSMLYRNFESIALRRTTDWQ